MCNVRKQTILRSLDNPYRSISLQGAGVIASILFHCLRSYSPIDSDVAAINHRVIDYLLHFTRCLESTSTSCANSSGFPSRCGKGVSLLSMFTVSS